ncbi:MAG: cytochrome c biogenesis protein CcsA [Acidimicrobiales bacterium]
MPPNRPGPRARLTAGARPPAARRAQHLVGLLALASLAATVWLGLWHTPPSVNLGQLVRLVYVHPPVAWVAYLAFGVTTLASAAYLWPRTRAAGWDRLAGASAEVGVLFAALTLATGSIWGRPTWGVWWTWDARLTTTALLAVLYIGYLALRRVPGDREVVARRAALAGLIAFADVPVNYLSVYWWRTLHQTGTVLDPSKQVQIHGIMAWTLLLGFCAFTLAYVWLVTERYQVAVLADRMADEGLEVALAERAAEAGMPAAAPLAGTLGAAGPAPGAEGLVGAPAGHEPAGQGGSGLAPSGETHARVLR